MEWVNHGLLTIFFFVVGLEIKREFTVGHLATFRSGTLPVLGALGGIVLPAVIYALIAPPELRHGWGIPIGTDTAFAVALIVLLGDRVPIELRVLRTAAVIIDGIVAAAWLAVQSGIVAKPEAYSWRPLVGAGALGGIGFTMSLFIAGQAFDNPADYAAAKIAIFVASIIAAVLETIILYPRRSEESDSQPFDDIRAVGTAL